MKNIKYLALILVVVVLAVVLGISGCISGITSVGWGGGAISGNTLYVGANGRLEAIDLVSLNTTFSQQVRAAAATSILSCACGTASAPVAIYGNPVIVNDLAYFAGYDGKIYYTYANSVNGSLRVFFPGEGAAQPKPFVGSPVYNNGALYIADSAGVVYALDAVTGGLKWSVAPEGKKKNQKIWATPAVDGGTLYIGSFDKKLYALNTSDGSKKWEFATEGAIMAAPLVSNGTLYFGSLDRNFYAVNAADGVEKWHISAKNWFWTQPVIVNGVMYIGALDSNVYLVNPATGAVTNTIKLDGSLASQPVVSGNNVVFVTMTGGHVWKIDTATQQSNMLVKLDYNVDGPIAGSNGFIYVHGFTGGGGGCSCSGTVQKLSRVSLDNGTVTSIPLN